MKTKRLLPGIISLLMIVPLNYGQDSCLNIYPNPPVDKIPLIASSHDADSIEQFHFRWLVNGVEIMEGYNADLFRVNFETGFEPDGPDSLISSAGATLQPGEFGTAAHIGDEYTRLVYSAENNISTDSGSISFWFSLDYDIDDPAYNYWNTLFYYFIDELNALDIDINKDRNEIAGVSLRNGEYLVSFCNATKGIKAGEWNHLVWTWNGNDSTQRVYLNNYNSAVDLYIPPVGNGDSINVGCSINGTSNINGKIDEFCIFNHALDEYEIEALYLMPGNWLSSALSPDLFSEGDTIKLIYSYYNGQAWSDDAEAGIWNVAEYPVIDVQLINDVLPPGTETASISFSTLVNARCRCDTLDNLYDNMSFEMDGAGTTDHHFQFNTGVDRPYTYFIRCAPDTNLNQPLPLVLQSNSRVLNYFSPDYPRLEGYFSSAANIAKYDLVRTRTYYISEIIEARKINPDLKVLSSGIYEFSYPGLGAEPKILAALHNPDNPLYNCLLCDPEGNILLDNGWLHPYYNLTNPACVNYVAELNLNRWKDDCLVYDGIYFDRVGIPDLWGQTIDSDRDSVADNINEYITAYNEGIKSLLAKIRERAPNAIIVGNAAALELSEWMNGAFYETALAQIIDKNMPFSSFIEDYRGWSTSHRKPWAIPSLQLQSPYHMLESIKPREELPADSIEKVKTMYDRMRFGLTAALLGDGFYYYNSGHYMWEVNWWYDEYDVILGTPVSEAAPWGNFPSSLCMDDFEDGSFGNYFNPEWCDIAEITSDSDKVISGNYSIYGKSEADWEDIINSDKNKIQFLPNTLYTIKWKYRVVEETNNGNFFLWFGSYENNQANEIYSKYWNPPAGTMDSISISVTTDSNLNNHLAFGISNQGAIVLDDIHILEGGEPVWRRDFDEGIALVNPSADTASIELEKAYYAILGTQDPLVNNGGTVTDLKIPPFDGRILMNESQAVGLSHSVVNNNSNRNLIVYPNPATARIHLINFSKEPITELHITDINGQIIYKININQGSDMVIDLDEMNVPGGMYILSAKCRNKTFHKKIIFNKGL